MEKSVEKGMLAIETYLQRQGFDIMEDGDIQGAADFACLDGKTVALVSATVKGEGGQPLRKGALDQEGFDRLAPAFLAALGVPCALMRFEQIEVRLMPGGAGFLRRTVGESVFVSAV